MTSFVSAIIAVAALVVFLGILGNTQKLGPKKFDYICLYVLEAGAHELKPILAIRQARATAAGRTSSPRLPLSLPRFTYPM